MFMSFKHICIVHAEESFIGKSAISAQESFIGKSDIQKTTGTLVWVVTLKVLMACWTSLMTI